MNKETTLPPFVLNVFKPTKITSYDVLRSFKKILPKGDKKIGHFGTLDPFACGVQLVAFGSATRLNDLIHKYLTKTYLAVGKLGVETKTGDLTTTPSQIDESPYLKETISSFSKEFIEGKLNEKFLGPYLQSPHSYSASKFEGKPLHEWARVGVVIKKEEVERHVYKIEVVKYEFPYLSIRVEVSSGTYVRTLFSDFSNYLGTIGTLVSLLRENIGSISSVDSLHKSLWPKTFHELLEIRRVDIKNILPINKIQFSPFEENLIKNGVPLKLSRGRTQIKSESILDYFLEDEDGHVFGIGKKREDEIKPYLNFSSNLL